MRKGLQMGARQRFEAAMRAEDKGREAFWRGEDIDTCPYKVSEWGIGGHWKTGWRKARAAAEEGARHAIYGNPLTDA